MSHSERHVIFVSLDALRSDFFLDPSWPAPTLQQRVAGGAHVVRLRSVAPALTYPAHASLVTGARPARHGIVYNRPFEPGGDPGRWYWEAEHLRARTLWEAVREAGGRTASLTWPVTVGAPIDWNVPEVWDPSGETPQIEVLARHSTPSALLHEVQQEVTGALPGDAFRGYDLIRAEVTAAIGGHILERHRPHLLAVHLVAVDAYQHEEGRDGPGVRRALAAADRAVGRMVDAVERAGMEDRTAFVVVGDHGFMDVHTHLAPNVWLAEAGLRGWDHGEGDAARAGTLPPDWRATFHVEDGAAFLHLRDPGDGEGAVRAREVLEALPGRVQRLYRLVEREEMDRLGAAPDAAFALSGQRGVAFEEEARGSAVRAGSGGAHGHFPDLPEMDAGLVAWGAGVRPGARADEAELTDVAPLVASLLGVAFEAPDGILLRGLLEGEGGPP